MALLMVNDLLAPLGVAVAWALWYRKDRHIEPAWRRRPLVAGMAAITLNVVMFYGWIAYAYLNGEAGMRVRDAISPVVSGLIVVALASAIVGKGAARGVVAVSVPIGFLLWVVPAIL